MRSNYKELGLLFLLLGMGAIMFASLAYVFEKEDENTTFVTMLDAYWWALITMTTVGFFFKSCNMAVLWSDFVHYIFLVSKFFYNSLCIRQ